MGVFASVSAAEEWAETFLKWKRAVLVDVSVLFQLYVAVKDTSKVEDGW